MTLTRQAPWHRTPITIIAALALLWGTETAVQSWHQPAQAQLPLSQSLPESPDTSVQDPLQSPFPLPWAWIEQQQQQAQRQQQSQRAVYYSDLFVSPDGLYQAQAELVLTATPDFAQNHLVSTLTVTQLQTGASQQWQSQTFLDPGMRQELPANEAGLIAVFWPVGWSASGEQLLVRQVQGIFSTDFVSDSAVIWSRPQQALHAIWPQQADYDHAIVLGWSHEQTQQVLFRTEVMGEAQGQIWAVDSNQETLATTTDYPRVFGQTLPATSQAQVSQP